jgi:hypothetical protein
MNRWTAEGSIEIAASAAEIYDLVSDVTGYGAWTAETTRARWLHGATGPVVGGRFVGWNQNSWHRWWTWCTVTAADPARLFEFQVSWVIPTALWRYEITPTAGGSCQVTERTARLIPLAVSRLANVALAGIADRDGHNRRNIAYTLQRLKEHAEAQARA